MATPLTQTQLNNAKHIVAVGKRRGMSDRDILTAINVAWVESKLKTYANPRVPDSLNIPHDDIASDHNSVGVFQQQVGIWGTASELMNLTTAANKFFDALAKLGNRNQMSVGQAAQTVQVSAHPDRYDAALPVSQEIYNRVANGDIGLDVDAYPEYKKRNPGSNSLVTALAWMRNPENWQRVGVFTLGALLIIFVLWQLLADSPVTKAAVKLAVK